MLRSDASCCIVLRLLLGVIIGDVVWSAASFSGRVGEPIRIISGEKGGRKKHVSGFRRGIWDYTRSIVSIQMWISNKLSNRVFGIIQLKRARFRPNDDEFSFE